MKDIVNDGVIVIEKKTTGEEEFPFAIHHGNHTFYGMYPREMATSIKYSDLPCPTCSKSFTLESTIEIELPENHPMAKKLMKLKGDKDSRLWNSFMNGLTVGLLIGIFIGASLI